MNAHVSAESENKQQVPHIHWKVMLGQCCESLLPPGGQKYVIAGLKQKSRRKQKNMSAVKILQFQLRHRRNKTLLSHFINA